MDDDPVDKILSAINGGRPVIRLTGPPAEIKQLADAGSTSMQRTYAQLLANGLEVNQNLREAARYYKMAADSGDSEAQFEYSRCLELGEGVPVDLPEACRYCKMAADQGHANAQFQYGSLLSRGSGVDLNLSEAARYFKMAADQGDAMAQSNYASLLFLGQGVPQDFREALRYVKMAADQGHPDGKKKYAAMLRLCKDSTIAKEEADKGDMEAQYIYGLRLFNGNGVARNTRESARYFKMAADQGSADAQFYYAGHLFEGLGVARDLQKAAHYYKLAADQGHAHAQKEYGVCLHNGEGVDVNFEESARYYKMAADQGDPSAQFCYGLCLRDGEGVPTDFREAARYFKMVADQGDNVAQVQYMMCSMYAERAEEEERGPSRELAVDQGDRQACEKGDKEEASPGPANMDQRLTIVRDDERKSSGVEPFCVCLFDFVHEGAKTTFKIRFNHHETLANVKTVVNSLFSLREGDCEWTSPNMGTKKLSDSRTLDDMRSDCKDEDLPAFQVKCKRNPMLVLPIKEGSMQIPIELPLSAKVKDLSAKLRERKSRPQARFQFMRGTETLFTDENASLNETILSDEPIDVKQVASITSKKMSVQSNPIAQPAPEPHKNDGPSPVNSRLLRSGTSKKVSVQSTPVASLASSTSKKVSVQSIVVQSPKNDGPDSMNPDILSSSGGQTIHCCILNDDEIVCEHDVPKTSTIESLFGLLAAKWQTGYHLCNDEGEPFPPQAVLSSISDKSHAIDFYLKKCSTATEERSSGDSRGSGGRPLKGSRPLSEWVVDFQNLSMVQHLPSRGSDDVQLFRQEDGKLIVGKFLNGTEDDDPQTRFQREGHCLYALDHPCIVKFAGYTLPCPQTENRFLLFTEYVTGVSLSSIIEKSSDFPWFDSTVRTIIVVGIVSALKYFHSQSLVHRDLTPRNIFVDEKHHPILCDFGSSRLLFDDATLTAQRTPELPYYTAPEVCNEGDDYDNKIDVYSFGILLYEIITGKLALRNLNMIQVTLYITEGKRPQIPNTVLPFTRELIESCWSQVPSERPSFEAIYHDIEVHNFRLFSDVDVRRVREYANSLPE